MSGNSKDLAAGWDHYYHVYRMIAKTLPSLLSLDLAEISPKLFAARNLKIAVPGTYLAKDEPVYVTTTSHVPRARPTVTHRTD
jgi:FKBP12-rapamycin complex-associated protein